MFKSVNELDKFIFDDCIIDDVVFWDETLEFSLEALIVGEGNSQNSNFTKSYADISKAVFSGCKIEKMIISGYKEYDANDNLINVVNDTEILENDYLSKLKSFKGAYLYRMINQGISGGRYIFDAEIEFVEDPQFIDLRADTYVVSMSFDESTVIWERYLNRVQ